MHVAFVALHTYIKSSLIPDIRAWAQLHDYEIEIIGPLWNNREFEVHFPSEEAFTLFILNPPVEKAFTVIP